MSKYVTKTYKIGWAIDETGRELTREERLAYEEKAGITARLNAIMQTPKRDESA